MSSSYWFTSCNFTIDTTDPGFMPEVQVDKGAIRFVLGGANIMCPGLTSKGGRMEEELPAETAVVRICGKINEGGRERRQGRRGI